MRYYLLVIGCQMNTSDAERIADLLERHGLSPAAAESDADVIIVVSCSVRQKAMDRIYGKLPSWRAQKDRASLTTVLTGCVLPEDKKRLAGSFDHILNIADIQALPSLLSASAPAVTQSSITNADYLALPSHHASSFQAFVPIMTGCNNYCTYCAVPYTRGEEASRPSSDIVNEVRNLTDAGYKEITLLGQNVNAYIDPEAEHDPEAVRSRARDEWAFKKDQPIQFRSATTNVPKDFARLLRSVNDIPGPFWIRFLTSNPQDVSDELIDTLPLLKKVTPYFHLPFQAGDDEILRKMNRRHTRDYYLQLVERIREAWPGAALTTDIIVGFPGETEDQFQQTIDVMERVRFDMAYIAEYSPRPGTAAERFFKDDVPSPVKRERKKRLNAILEKTAHEQNQKLLGKTVPVLVDSYDSKQQTNRGKTDTFKSIHFPGPDQTGQFCDVTVEQADIWGLSGQAK